MMPESLRAEYELHSRLKEDGARATLLLRDRSADRLVVLKRSPESSGELQTEYAMLTRLAAPDLPAGYRLFFEDGSAYLLREYVEGETLLEYSLRRGPLPVAEVIDFGARLCATLKRFHAQQPPVIHRDVKLENVVRRPDGQLKLIDLGIAREYSSAAPRDTQVLGTPAIAPPEQFGYRQTDARSDIYALGVLLRQLAAGDAAAPVPDRGLSEILRRCTSFDPDRRYRDAHALERALLRLSRMRRLRRALAAAAGAILLFLAALALVRLPKAPAPAADVPAGPAGPTADEAALNEIYAFSSPAIERAVRGQLGRPEGDLTRGDLARVQTLLLCGEESPDDWGRISSFANDLRVDGHSVASWGTVDALDDIPNLPNLRTLALCNQHIEDLSPLAGTGIQQLSLHGNWISDLRPLAECPFLRELDVSWNPVTDFSALQACPALWALNADATRIASVDTLLDLPALSRLSLRECADLGSISALSGLEPLRVLFLQPVTGEMLADLQSLTQLDALYLWKTERLTSLAQLSELTRLQMLFVDSSGLSTLDGIGRFPLLSYLNLRNSPLCDLSALSSAQNMSWLELPDLKVVDWAPLKQLPRLATVICDESQLEALRALSLKADVRAGE